MFINDQTPRPVRLKLVLLCINTRFDVIDAPREPLCGCTRARWTGVGVPRQLRSALLTEMMMRGPKNLEKATDQ